MNFYKMQGAGNDFIIINNMDLNIPVEDLLSIAKKLCERRVSIGADGFMVVDHPTEDADFKMRFYNQDGTLGEMCGNGARCIARYAYVNGIANREMEFETIAGLVYAEVLDNRQVKVQLNNPEVIKLGNNIKIDNKEYECSYIELGNPGLPHAVIKLDFKTMGEEDLFDLGKKMRYYSGFPKGVNVNFYEILNEDTVQVKTYERGVEDFTLACGTGSASVAVVLFLKGYSESNKIDIISDGGKLAIEIDKTNDDIKGLYLIGDTNIVAVGRIMDEDLEFIYT